MIEIKNETNKEKQNFNCTEKISEIIEFMDGNSYSLEESCKALDYSYDDLTCDEIEYIENEMIMCERCLTYSHLYDVHEDGCEVCIGNKVLGF